MSFVKSTRHTENKWQFVPYPPAPVGIDPRLILDKVIVPEPKGFTTKIMQRILDLTVEQYLINNPDLELDRMDDFVKLEGGSIMYRFHFKITGLGGL